MMQGKQHFNFSAEKNQKLITERGISFEQVIMAIETGDLLDILPHYNLLKYPHQQIYLVHIDGYIYVVPFVVEDNGNIFLKTIFPHRKLAKQYLRGEPDEKS
jgi:uncharacterized DUF497 family protein